MAQPDYAKVVLDALHEAGYVILNRTLLEKVLASTYGGVENPAAWACWTVDGLIEADRA